MLVVYAASFYSGSLWDDNVFIFKAEAITHTSHPFVFFDYTSSNHRAWPLGYVFFWILYRVFAENFVWYKLLNLLIHFLNFYLLRKFLVDSKVKHSLFIGLLFLFHPLQVESVSWIFQLNTLLATSFTLLCLNSVIQNKYKLSLLFFALSLLTKSYAVFLPFVFFLIFLKSNSFKKSLVRTIPFFIISLLVGLLTIRGVTSSDSENVIRKKFHTEKSQKVIKEETIVSIPSPSPIEVSEPTPSNTVYEEASRAEIIDEPEVAQEVPDQVQIENASTSTEESLQKETTMVVVKEKKVFDWLAFGLDKLQLVANSLSFYIKSFTVGGDHFLFYPFIDPLSLTNIYNLLFLFIIMTAYAFCLVDTKVNKSTPMLAATFLICSWLPISGIFYVPFMKFAHYSDHWAYLCTIPMAVLLIQALDYLVSRFKLRAKMSTTMVGLIFVMPIAYNLIKTIQYSSVFNDHELMLRRNIVHNPDNMFVRRYLAAKLYRNGEIQYAIEELTKAQNIDPRSMEVKIQLDYYKDKLKKER
tara:strand:+ start:3270 stop:4847 length:1578 start_codon:yes stop_codon:yes gene_type:complete